jgi:heterodisulfide reductase subunit C
MIDTARHLRGSPFLREVIDETPGGERIVHCLQCGSCGGSCPNGADMQYTPRAVFALINADKREEVLTSNTMWCCVSCYFCTTRCPQKIPITEIMYCLKRLSIRDGLARNTDAPALAKTFTDLVARYGRSFELGLASRYYLFNKPLAMLRMGPLGLRMFTRGRMSLLPTKIKNLDQLQAIINKAKELGGGS